MTLQAWDTLPSCFANSSSPTFTLMIFWSLLILGSSFASPARAGKDTEDRLPHCQVRSEHFHLNASLNAEVAGQCSRFETDSAHLAGRRAPSYAVPFFRLAFRPSFSSIAS